MACRPPADHEGLAWDRSDGDFADAIRWAVRKQDIAFRIGGDEFLLMLVGADRTEAEQVLDRLRLADEHMYANKRSRDVPAD